MASLFLWIISVLVITGVYHWLLDLEGLTCVKSYSNIDINLQLIIIYIQTLFWAIRLCTFYFAVLIWLQSRTFHVYTPSKRGHSYIKQKKLFVSPGNSALVGILIIISAILWTVYSKLVAEKPEVILIISTCVIRVHVHTCIMCKFRKYWYPRQGWSLEILSNKFFKWKHKAKLEIPQGYMLGGLQTK